MRPHFNFKALEGLPADEQRKRIAKAVAFNLHMPQLILDTMGEKAAYLRAAANDGHVGVKSLAGMPAIKAPTAEDFERTLRSKYATQDQNPNLTTATNAATSWFHSNMPEIDTGYLPLFDLIDLRGTPHSSFDVETTSAGITWVERKAGGKTQIRREFSEAKVTVNYVEYTAGLGILDTWLQFNQFWKVSDAVAEFMSTEQDKRAEIHYGLLTALGSGVNETFATDAATTFNNACAAIIRNVSSSGYAVGANPQFDIVCQPEKLGYIVAMLEATRGSVMVAYGTQNQPIVFSVRNVISTRHIPAASTSYYLVLPGRKMKRGLWKDLTLESKRDIYVSAEDWVGSAQYNASIADTNQVRRVLYA